tara:strand:- start:920 stop:1384 length:465 start_codon:yes stop_codon:yes gene_type:complete
MGIFWIILVSLFKPAHDFHVSISQAEWEDGLLKCTIRVFSDDLEMSLQKDYGRNYRLETAINDDRLGQFVLKYFGFRQDDQILKGEFVGMEIENDLSFLYLQFPLEKAPSSLEVYNLLFFDSFEDQSNIVNVQCGSVLRSAFLSPQKNTQILEF